MIKNYEDSKILEELMKEAQPISVTPIRCLEWRDLGYTGPIDSFEDFKSWLLQEHPEYNFQPWEIDSFAHELPCIIGIERGPNGKCLEVSSSGGYNRNSVDYPSIEIGKCYNIDDVLKYYGRKREV